MGLPRKKHQAHVKEDGELRKRSSYILVLAAFVGCICASVVNPIQSTETVDY